MKQSAILQKNNVTTKKNLQHCHRFNIFVIYCLFRHQHQKTNKLSINEIVCRKEISKATK